MKGVHGLALITVALGWACCGAASAQGNLGALYVYEALLDTDNNVATGGPVSVVQGSEAPHNEVGIDYIVRVGAGVVGVPDSIGATFTGPAVLYRDVLKWNPNTASFDVVDHNLSTYPLGTNIDGNGLVEFGAARSLIGNPQGPIRGVFHAFKSHVFDNDYTRSFVIGAVRAPAHSAASLAVLLALLLTSGIVLVRKRRHRSKAVVFAAVVLLAASIAWAQQIVLDGDFADWAGIVPVVTDPPGDSSIHDLAEDILAGYAVIQGQNIFFRLDLVSLCCLE